VRHVHTLGCDEGTGAIDFNVEFAINEANQHSHKGAMSTNAKLYPSAETDDSYSVCEGEPLYTPNPRKRKASAISCHRGPRHCLTSLNGVVVHGLQDMKYNDNMDNKEKCEATRDAFFKEYIPSGVAVTKWAYGRKGHQQNQFVATSGGTTRGVCDLSTAWAGLNTICADEDIEVGDTVVVDIPMFENTAFGCRYDGMDRRSNFGFLQLQKKRGIPTDKLTLVVRAMPSDQGVKQAFAKRGQILGTCVSSGGKGKRIDIVLSSTAVGLVSTGDMFST
jgi:hypothetical protein